ncbi:hypothetical protein OG562_17415 [Streptomyces sp. NBC_01275]|uniref:hypothetical protein n=1 Tax=Streptomyces sp. NBC_01275 TaxID=2903807 RepID=UPI00225BB83F|nr:hypothetical protein [Streptomyces sp. NBC_01275]MCX4762725.1 hypothetical protein [Streptomyces sp. NBC_01275]
MSEITGQSAPRATATTPIVHESYAFACMRCGHGWEQSYAIEHHVDADGHEFVQYVADGRVVPSPLSRPACQNCDGHVLRIMRAGQVSSVLSAARQQRPARPASRTASADGPTDGPEAQAQAGEPHHHWHLSDLLHPFQRKAS